MYVSFIDIKQPQTHPYTGRTFCLTSFMHRFANKVRKGSGIGPLSS